jgi:hypothetical protein
MMGRWREAMYVCLWHTAGIRGVATSPTAIGGTRDGLRALIALTLLTQSGPRLHNLVAVQKFASASVHFLTNV